MPFFAKLQSHVVSSVWPWIELSRAHLLVGPLLCFWPCAWGLTTAARLVTLPFEAYLRHLFYGLVAAALYHSAGCIWNDILDCRFDRQVERTKNRPIADGRISLQGALAYLVLHTVVLTRMIWGINPLSWNTGMVAIFLLGPVYPLLKRVTYWPQAWLGLTMNAGVMMALAVMTGAYSRSSVVLTAGAWSWTIYYDTVYACQDRADDKVVGIKSTALLFGDRTRSMLTLFACVFLVSLIHSGMLDNHTTSYYLISVGGTALHLGIQLYSVDLDNPRSCKITFFFNGLSLGAIVWAGLLVDYVLA